MSKKSNILPFKLVALTSLPLFALAFTSCEVKKTQEGEMPDVKVEGGSMPKYDVQTPDITVGKKEIALPDSITVPEVNIVTPEEQREAAGSTPAAEMTPEPGMSPGMAEPTPAMPEPAPVMPEATPADSAM